MKEKNIFSRLREKEKRKEKFICGFEIVLYIFAVIYQHISLPVVHDDIVRSKSEFRNFFEIVKYYWNYNGRITTDSLAEILNHHRNIWIVVDCLAYVALVVLLVKIFKRFSPAFLGLAELLTLVFPFRYWESAGYVSTTTNYLYSTVCFLGVIFFIKELQSGRKKVLKYLLAMLCIAYIAFSNQFIIGAILFLLYVIMYQLWVNKKSVKQIFSYVGLEIWSVFLFGVMWFSPGYQARMNGTEEMLYWLPQYQYWSFLKKIIEGYTTTVANVVFKDNSLLLILCVAIMILGLYTGKKMIVKVIATVPSICMFLLRIKGYEKFIVYYKYAGSKPDIKVNLASVKSLVALSFPMIIFIAVVISLYLLMEDIWMRCFAICMLVIGAVSREMMGFTATIYASDFRTFTLFFFCIILAILCVGEEMFRKGEYRAVMAIEMVSLICWLMQS